ncbi:MAG: hypothetical protein GF317_11870 [Candidatus Lokiarchaeota archaeon]|nr:hypothetical protein [Candidatus Lokiarchaeota archaeon]MBD3200344.1 hypothetical protein [Candidatus Lokiarchaeota archaeon]
MLTATIEQNGNKRIENIYVVDSHSHLGQDEDGAAMMNPLAPGSGTFDFWSKIQGKIQEDWEETGEQSFSTSINGKTTKISFSFNPYPLTHKILIELEKLGEKHSDIRDKMQYNSFIDQAVVFPFQDVFRAKRPEALYRASNLNISRFTKRFPFSMKLIGYCRVDPMEGEKAVQEVKHSREVLGLSGLKLHPRSEGWVDQASTEKPIPILMEAIKHSMPILFDTRGKKTILDIGRLVERTRTYLKSNNPKLLSHFKVIIAHFAQGNVGDEEVYETVVQPNTYGDLSMLHGEGAGNFFEDFREWFKENDKIKVDGRDWSQYLLFATDYPYFGEIHAEKLLIYTFNKRFFEGGGNLMDTRNILGLNQLKLLPRYNLIDGKGSSNSFKSTLISNPDYEENQQSTYDLALNALASLLSENKIDIKNFHIQFEKEWDNLSENALFTTIHPIKKEEIQLLLYNLVKDKITILAPIKSKKKWNKFGYMYFDPKDRNLFRSMLESSYLALDLKTIVDSLNQIFT